MEIEGYNNYLIYEDGRVQNKKTKRYLKNKTNSNGYICLKVCKDGITKNLSIHRLIALHYIPNPDNKICVDHINRDKNDNSVKNLRWVDRSTNCENKDIISTNTSGIKNVSYHKGKGLWIYQKKYNKVKFERSSLNKILILWIKFVYEITD